MPARRKHILPSPELELPRTLHDDRHRLEEVQVPIVTISATFRTEIAKNLGEGPSFAGDVVLSRAHYSMAIAVFSAASNAGLSAWLVDPINYVSPSAWDKVLLTQRFGRLAARVPFVKFLKNLSDRFIRAHLPLSGALKDPLLYVTARASLPIISLHYEAGNLLAASGKKVLQVVTDPHVRPHYLFESQRENIVFAVFDENTKKEFLRKAREMNKEISDGRIVITGPPVDPRVVRARKNKDPKAFLARGLRLLVTTGGLGTNKDEIKSLLENILPHIEKENISLILYAGTQLDFREMFYELPRRFGVPVSDVDGEARVRVIYDESIIRANQELIEHAFPWADGVVTKPSGDMAYDAAVSGCFILFLEPWGEWEENARKIFIEKGVGKNAQVKDFYNQLKKEISSGFIEQAIGKAIGLPPVFLNGAEDIVKLQQRLAKEG